MMDGTDACAKTLKENFLKVLPNLSKKTCAS